MADAVTARDAAMAAAWDGGELMASIGPRYGVTPERVRQVLAKSGRTGRQPAFSVEEQGAMRALNRCGVKPTEIARALRRQQSSVIRWLVRAGLHRRAIVLQAWTPAEDAAVRRDYRRIPAREIAHELGRSKNEVIGRAHRLGLSKGRRSAT